jgi:hypothetical protein
MMCNNTLFGTLFLSKCSNFNTCRALKGKGAVDDPCMNETKNLGMEVRQATAAVHHAVVLSCISKQIEGIEVIRFRIVEEKQGFVIGHVHKS